MLILHNRLVQLSSHFMYSCVKLLTIILIFFFFNDTATTEIYTLSLHDALPIFLRVGGGLDHLDAEFDDLVDDLLDRDRKSTRLNSSHANISYAVFCLKKKMIELEQAVCKEVGVFVLK